MPRDVYRLVRALNN